jgi:hypothetical protein
VDFLVNDRSIHGQFHAISDFFAAVERLMRIRGEILRLGSELFCHRAIANAPVTPNFSMPQAIQSMDPNKQRAWIHWLTRFGPYWTDVRQHGTDDWLEIGNGTLVTDTAIGEAAFCRLHDLNRELVSITPSDWLIDPITVTWRRSDQSHRSVDVRNHWTLETISQSLATAPLPFDSWRTLDEHSRKAFHRLTFSEDAFDPLDGHPYASGAAERIWVLLGTLDNYCGCFDENGKRTAEGDRIYANHFTGDKAWFSDSSASEKNDFKKELTFSHPERPAEYLFCPWHGKVKTPQLRIHFSWPITARNPTYVVYVGPKITKR